MTKSDLQTVNAVRVSDEGRVNTGTSSLRDAITANVLLFLSFGALFIVLAVGCPLTALLVYTSKRNRELGDMWVRYHKEIIRMEHKLLKS